MAKAEKGKKVGKRRRWIRWEYLVLIVLMGLFTIKFLDKTQQIQALGRQEVGLSYQNRQLATANAQMRRTLRYEATNSYAESAARALGYTSPGETSVQVILKNSPVRKAKAPVDVKVTPTAPPWQQWWDAFSH